MRRRKKMHLWQTAAYSITPLSGRTSHRAYNEDQNASSNEACNQISKPATKAYAKHAEEPTGKCSANDTEQYVHEQAHIAFHELLSQPTRYASNDNGGYPTGLIFHTAPPLPLEE